MGFSIYILVSILAYFIFNFTRIWTFVKKRKRMYQLVANIDGPLALPIVGTTFQFKLDPVEFSIQLYNWGIEYAEKGASLAKFWIGPHPMIIVLTPDAVKILIEQLEEATQQAKDHIVDAFPYIKRCALDIICETAMGTTVNAQTNHTHPYVTAVAELNNLSFKYQRMPWLWVKPIRYLTGFEAAHRNNLDIVTSFTKNVIEKKTREFGENGKQAKAHAVKKAFLDMLIEMKEEGGLGYEDIREEVDTFMFEGHDTTSAGIGWSLWCLASNPQYQKMCHNELDAIFGFGSNRDCTVADIKQMKYLEKCVKEALRIRPSVPQFARVVDEEFEIDGMLIPQGCSVLISPAFMQNNPRTFPNHEIYDPERFSEEQISKRHAYCYIPFSAGPRNCVGQKFAMQEEKTVISWVLRHFEVFTDVGMLENVPLPETIMRPTMGFPLKFTLRK